MELSTETLYRLAAISDEDMAGIERVFNLGPDTWSFFLHAADLQEIPHGKCVWCDRI